MADTPEPIAEPAVAATFKDKHKVLSMQSLSWESDYRVVVSAIKQKPFDGIKHEPRTYFDLRLWWRNPDSIGGLPIPTEKGFRIRIDTIPALVRAIVNVYQQATGKEIKL